MPTDKRQRQKEGQRARRAAALAATRRQQQKRRVILAVVLAGLIAGLISILSIAGGDDDKKETTPSASADGGGTTNVKLAVGDGEKVSVKINKTPPTELVKKDLKEGDGAAAKLGDQIEVNYVGVTYADGKEFDSSFKGGETATFGLTEGGLIDGWVQGIPGMKVGGRRELIIPAALAYGESPQGGRPAGALIFIVDLVAIK